MDSKSFPVPEPVTPANVVEKRRPDSEVDVNAKRPKQNSRSVSPEASKRESKERREKRPAPRPPSEIEIERKQKEKEQQASLQNVPNVTLSNDTEIRSSSSSSGTSSTSSTHAKISPSSSLFMEEKVIPTVEDKQSADINKEEKIKNRKSTEIIDETGDAKPVLETKKSMSQDRETSPIKNGFHDQQKTEVNKSNQVEHKVTVTSEQNYHFVDTIEVSHDSPSHSQVEVVDTYEPQEQHVSPATRKSKSKSPSPEKVTEGSMSVSVESKQSRKEKDRVRNKKLTQSDSITVVPINDGSEPHETVSVVSVNSDDISLRTETSTPTIVTVNSPAYDLSDHSRQDSESSITPNQVSLGFYPVNHLFKCK